MDKILLPEKEGNNMDRKKHDPKTEAVIRSYAEQRDRQADPGGSYTGRPINPKEKPVQDADDL